MKYIFYFSLISILIIIWSISPLLLFKIFSTPFYIVKKTVILGYYSLLFFLRIGHIINT